MLSIFGDIWIDCTYIHTSDCSGSCSEEGPLFRGRLNAPYMSTPILDSPFIPSVTFTFTVTDAIVSPRRRRLRAPRGARVDVPRRRRLRPAPLRRAALRAADPGGGAPVAALPSRRAGGAAARARRRRRQVSRSRGKSGSLIAGQVSEKSCCRSCNPPRSERTLPPAREQHNPGRMLLLCSPRRREI